MISNGSHKYICYAIDKAYATTYDIQKLRDAKQRLIGYVNGSLEGSGTLGSWLMERSGLFMPYELQKEARIAWLTWMLGEEVVLKKATLQAFKKYTWVRAKPSR